MKVAGRECQIVKVHVLSTEQEDKVREVHVPTTEAIESKKFDLGVDATDGITNTSLLNAVWHYGQNEFAFGPELNTTASVSMGDVVELDDGRLIIVQTAGFAEITRAQYDHYLKMDRRDRYFADITMGDHHSLFIVTDEGVTNRRES